MAFPGLYFLRLACLPCRAVPGRVVPCRVGLRAGPCRAAQGCAAPCRAMLRACVLESQSLKLLGDLCEHDSQPACQCDVCNCL